MIVRLHVKVNINVDMKFESQNMTIQGCTFDLTCIVAGIGNSIVILDYCGTVYCVIEQ
jgi:hypothetical protein